MVGRCCVRTVHAAPVSMPAQLEDFHIWAGRCPASGTISKERFLYALTEYFNITQERAALHWQATPKQTLWNTEWAELTVTAQLGKITTEQPLAGQGKLWQRFYVEASFQLDKRICLSAGESHPC